MSAAQPESRRATRSTGVPSPAGSNADGSRPSGDAVNTMVLAAAPAVVTVAPKASRASSGVAPAGVPPKWRAASASSASVVLHVVPVWASSAIASEASRVSKPGNMASSKPPSDCCWVFSHATAASAVACDAGSAACAGDEKSVNEKAAVSVVHHATARRTCDMGIVLRGPFPRGPCPAVLLNGVHRVHRWPGGQRQVAWLAECGGVPQSRSQLRVSVGLAPTSPVPGPEPGNRTQHPGCAQPLSRGHVSPT